MNGELPTTTPISNEPGRTDASYTLLDLAVPLAESWKTIVGGALAVGLIALGLTYAVAPTFTARATFLPPQQQQSSAASALASSLGALSGLAGAVARTPGDQYVALLQSATVEDRLIDRFKLMAAYGAEYRVDARQMLEQRVRISLGKRDGIITVEVDDQIPQRAADIANQHIEELRRLTSDLTLTEAKQRRVFFQNQLQETREKLDNAQLALQTSGFNAGALRAEPRAAAETYSGLRAELTAAEVRLQMLRQSLTDTAPEVQQLLSRLSALRSQVARVEASSPPESGPGYITRYREFKYQETLFDLFSRQYELAKVDESREGTLIQVIDAASVPERKSRPRRSVVAIVWTLGAGLVLTAFVFMRYFWRLSARDSDTAARIKRLRFALLGR